MSELTAERKEWIENADYSSLLHLWRFEPSGSVWFSNAELYTYYKLWFDKRRAEVGPEGHTAASKMIGWE